MDLSQFLIYVLLVTASGITLNKNSMMAQSFLNPTAVAAAFQNSSPQEIEYMITLINTLIADNDDVAQTAIDAFENANATFFDAQQAFHDAVTDKWLALGRRDTGEGQVAIWMNKVSVASAALNDAEVPKAEAQAQMDEAQMYYDVHRQKLDVQKATLEELLALLTDMKRAETPTDEEMAEALLEGSEQSVSEKQTLESNTDQLHAMMFKVDIPGLLDQLHAIEAMIVGAKDTVEAARKQLLYSLKDAKEIFDHADLNYETAFVEYHTLQDELYEHRTNQADRVARLEDAYANLNATRANLDDAQSHLDAALSHKYDAISHSEGANGELTSVKDLLAELLSEKSGEEDLSDA